MWAMQQSTQPNYIPANQDEENYNPNLNSSSQAKQRSAGRTHFNVYLNTPQQQVPHEQHQYASSPPLQQFAPPHPNMWFSPPPVYVQAPPPPPLYTYPPPYGMQPLQSQQQPTVIFMQQPPPEQKKKEEPPKKEIKEKKKEEPKPPPPPPAPVAPPPPPPPPKPDEMLDICIASIIIFCIGFMLGICSVVRSNDAYEAHIDYEEEGSTNKSGTLYETWQMARNTALGTGAAAVVCFSLAFLLVFWSGINHKMYRGVQPGFCMAGCLISGWIVFALTFLVDVVVLVLAFDSDNVVYPEVVWAAFVGNVVAWLLMLTHSELARRVE